MAAALLAGACSKKTGGGVKLKTDTDSVAYVIGMNVGMNLMKMDFDDQRERLFVAKASATCCQPMDQILGCRTPRFSTCAI